jgi:hypothetical protein
MKDRAMDNVQNCDSYTLYFVDSNKFVCIFSSVNNSK